VAFEFVGGAEPGGDLVRWFGALGGITARLHAHAQGWARPGWFTRRRWDFSAMFGPDAAWGSWRAAGVDAAEAAVLARGEALIGRFLAGFGEGADRFGLIHADLRLANLLAEGERLRVIDFDDCGFGWFAYDFAAAVSFFEDAAEVPALLDAWVAGYRGVRPLAEEQVAAMPVFVAARRLLLTGWVASHRDVAPVGPDYATGTVAVVEEVIRKFSKKARG
jgi:Ser/Thr protein kinase RdoA (MazF antagonist)